jgi:hypothetical protein
MKNQELKTNLENSLKSSELGIVSTGLRQLNGKKYFNLNIQ